MRKEKQLLLDEIKQKIDASQAMIVTRYDRFPPNLSWDFRDQLAKFGSLFEVVRKRILLKAAEQSGIKIDASLLKGHIGVVFVQQADAMAPAKLLYQFSEANQNLLEVVYGKIEGKALSGSEVEMLSKLPSINELRAKFIGLLVSPMAQMISVLEAVAAEPLSILEQKS